MAKNKFGICVGDIFYTNTDIKSFYQVVEVKDKGIVAIKKLIKFMEQNGYHKDTSKILITTVKDYFEEDTHYYKNETISKKIMGDEGEPYLKFPFSSNYDIYAYLWNGKPILDDWSNAWRD